MAFSNPNLLPVDASTFEGGTSSWSATGTNSTSIAATNYRLNGAYALRVTATAAGSASVWSPRTAVAAGSEYVIRIPVGLANAQAGLTCTATVEWWSAAVNGSKIGEAVSPGMTLSNAVGFVAANYPVIIAKAPTGATHVLIKLSVNNLAAGAQFYLDDIYLGVTPARAGNAYPYNTASIEQDASAWGVDSGTIERAGWVLIPGQGYYGLQVTSAVVGNQKIRPNAFSPVTPGKEYVSWASVFTASAALSWIIEFRWYTAGFTEVGTPAASTFDVRQSAVTRIGVTGKAPAGATQCKVFIRPQATAIGQVFVIDDASLMSASNPAGNLLSYADYSAEGVLPPWVAQGAAVAMEQISSAVTDGYFVVKFTPSAPGLISATLDRLVPVTPGTTYQLRGVIFRHATSAVQVITSAVRTRIDWYDSAGNLFQADNPDQFYTSDAAAEFWISYNTSTRTAPEGAAYAKLGLEVTSDNPLVDYWTIDNVTFMEAVAEYTLETSNETGCVTLVVNFAAPTAPTTDYVTIRRMDQDGRAEPMRGYGQSWELAPNPHSPILVEDYEAPLGSRVWYSISWSDSTGANWGARINTQLIDSPTLSDADYVWFKSPGIPALNTTVQMEAPLKWSRAARSTRYDIVGRKNPVNKYDVRAGRSSSITVLVWDPEANALFDSLLDTGAAALIQAMPGYGIEGNLYVSVGDVEVEPLSPDARDDGWRWTLAITEVDRPDGGLQGSAASTWQNVADSYATWEALFTAHSQWTTVLTKG